MPTTTQTPYMSLLLPIPLVELSPTWAIELNAAMTVVDSHDHSPGKGVQVPTAGLNINADLTFAGYNATNLRAVRMNNQGAALSGASDVGCLYVSGGDLFYNSSSGQQVHITSGAALNLSSTGSISGLSGTNAALTYSSTSQTFTFTQNSGITASVSSGPITIAQNTLSAPGITLQSPLSLASAYTLTLPQAAPGSSGQLLATDTGGNLSWSSVDNSTLQTVSGSLSVKPQGITTTQIADGSVTQVKRAALPYFVTASCGNASTTSGSWVSIPNFSGGLTTSGRPVKIEVIPDGGATAAAISGNNGFFRVLRDGSQVGSHYGGTTSDFIPASTLSWADFPPAGVHTYTMQFEGTAQIVYAAMFVREL